MKQSILITLLFFLPLFKMTATPNRFQELADELYASGNKEKAFRTYGDAIKADFPEDNNFELYINAGDCAYELNYKQIAFSYYCIAAQKEAPAQQLIKHIKEVYCNGDIDCTGKTTKQIISKHPGTSDSLSYAIADLLYRKARYEDAIPLFKNILEKQPDNIYTKSRLADALLHSNDIDSAKILYQEIIETQPNDIEASLFLGNYYYIIAKEAGAKDADLSTEAQSKAINFYEKSASFLEKVYSSKKSDVVRMKLIDIYTITKNKEKLNGFK